MEIKIVLFNAVLVFPSETKKDKKKYLENFLEFSTEENPYNRNFL